MIFCATGILRNALHRSAVPRRERTAKCAIVRLRKPGRSTTPAMIREATMDHDRRAFLKTSGIVGMAAMTGASPATKAAAQGGARTAEPAQLPKGMTFATLRRGDGFGLGLRTERGIL